MPKRKLIYLGWQGHGNFGDDLLQLVWSKMLNDEIPINAYLNRREYFDNWQKYLADRTSLIGSKRKILLGGGTTIGFEVWAQHIQLAQRMYGTTETIIAGAGAATTDDSFSLALQPQDWELWNQVSGIELHGVRGPRTAQICDQQWGDNTVIGDPALVYPALIPAKSSDITVPTRNVSTGAASNEKIGISLGVSPDSRFDFNPIVQVLNDQLLNKNYQSVTVFALSDTDQHLAKNLAAKIDGPTKIVNYEDNVIHVTKEIGSCSLFVSERLHGCIAAVSLGIPTVMLAYASKSVDFWESISTISAEYTLIDPSFKDRELYQKLSQAIKEAQKPENLNEIDQNLQKLQKKILEVASEINDWLRG